MRTNLFLFLNKLNKYKNRGVKELYTLKYNYYKNLLQQNGGRLIDEVLTFDAITPDRIKLLLIRYKQDIKQLLLDPKNPTQEIQKDILGCGANGCVFLLTDNSIIKILSNIDSFNKEMENSDVINNLSSKSPFFPKFKCMMQRKIENTDVGIIVSEKLEPMSLIFDFINHKFKDDTYKQSFYSQLWFIYYMIYEYYKKTKVVILHNDIKLDNFMLREIIDSKVNYNYKGLKDISIPYIIINNKKYVLSLIDFGESFIFDSSDINAFNTNNKSYITNNIVTLFKYNLTADGETIDESSLLDIYKSLKTFLNSIYEADGQNAGFYNEDNKQIFTDVIQKKIFIDLTRKFT